MTAVGPAGVLCLAGLGQLLGGVLADRLDEAVARRAGAGRVDRHPGTIDEAAQEVEGVGSGDGLGGGEIEAPDEDRETAQQPFAGLVEEVVTPVDGGPEGAVA